ncbi:TldD/PmbA family protein [candidate division KSB1 bacterium]|nr:TldD/PmbA family protein [candidate division KSB1 bacterium]
MKTKDRLNLAQWVMETAGKLGANETAVSLSNRREVEIEYRDKKLDKVKESVQNSLNLNIYVDQKYSGHSTNDLRKESLKTFIDEAIRSTRYLSKDEFRTLPDPSLYPENQDQDLKILDDNYENVSSQQRVQLAEKIEAAVMAQSDRIISTTSAYSDTIANSVKVHSNGFQGGITGTQFWMGAEVTVDDGQGGRPEDWFYAGTRFINELPTPEEIGEIAAQRALRKIGQEKIESGKYTMLVENRSGSRLFGMLRSPMTAQALQQKRSFLDGMLNQKIASEKLTIIDDPFLEKGLASRYYDGEGIASKRRVLVEKGVLKTYLIDNYYGKKLGLAPNSGSTANITLEYGDQSQEELLKTIDKGILITGFIGGNSNSTTGDFSFGIVGMLIEKGAIVKPLNEMNISGNSKEFWNKLVAVGNDPYPYSSQRLPSLMFEDINFSGI